MASKSLGTLTLDLVAKTAGFVQGMSKAERESAKWKKQVKRDIETVSKSMLAFAGVATAALGAITVNTIRTANEINRLSQVSGASAKEFQRYAAGAKLVGIEQEKLGDIFKDTNDKVGDFLQNGGGPLKDFFDNIAPQVGVTADQFRNLSGPQALGLYVSSLEKANVSQSEMTFYLEAIANDATLLLPLLKNNSQGFRELGDAAEGAGAILSDDLLASADELNAAMLILDQNFTGVKNQVAGELIPVLSDLATQLTDVKGDGSEVAQVAELIGDALKGTAAAAVGAGAAFQIWGKALGGQVAVVKAFVTGGLDAAREATRALAEDLDATAQKAATRINELLSAGDGSGDSQISRIAQVIRESREAAVGALSPIANDLEKINVLAKKREVPKSIQEALDLQIEYQQLIGSLRTDEEVVLDTLRERLNLLERINTAYGNATPGQGEARARSIGAAFGGDAPDYGGLSPEIGGAFSEFKRIEDAREQLEEWYSDKIDLLREAREQELITQDEYNSLELEKAQQHQDALAEIEQARQYVALATAEETFGSLADIAKQFAGEQSDAYKVLFAFEKGVAIARSIIAIQTAIAQAAASGPFPANLAAMATVAAQTASIIANIQSASISGQAHDGMMSVPKTGTYILEKGERVVSAETTKKMDQKLDGMGSTGNIRIVNAFDTSEVVGGYMGSSDGERAVMNIVRKNQRTIKSLSA